MSQQNHLFLEISNQTRCEKSQTLIVCDGDVSNITCPDSMIIYILDGFYGRNGKDV